MTSSEQGEPPLTIAQRIEELPKRPKAEDLKELKGKIEELDDAVETVAQLDAQQERFILREKILLQQVLSRFRSYELQLKRLEAQDLTEEERSTVSEIKRLMASLREDIKDYEHQEAQLFQDERSVLRRNVVSKAIDYSNGRIDYTDYQQFLMDIPDGSLDHSDKDAISYALHMGAFDRNGGSNHNYEWIALLLLPKIAPGAFRNVGDVAGILRSRDLSAGTKIAFLDKISADTLGGQAFGRFLIDWSEKSIDDLGARLGALPDGSITDRETVDELVLHVLETPALKNVVAAKVSADLKEYFSTEVYGARLDEVTTESESGRYYATLRERSEKSIPEIVAILAGIPQGSLRDEDQYQAFLFSTFYYPEQQVEMARKFATQDISTLWNFRHIMKWTRNNPSLQSTFSYHGKERIEKISDLLEFLAWTADNPKLQEPFLRMEDVDQWAREQHYYAHELIKKTSNHPDFQDAVLRALPRPQTVADFVEMAGCFASGRLGKEWLEPIADGSLEVEKPEKVMGFVTLFPVEAYPLAASKIANVSWDTFMHHQENYLDKYIIDVEEYKLSQTEYPFVTEYPTLFVDTQPYGRDDSVPATFEFPPRIATADDLQKAMDRIPEMNKESKSKVWALWEKYESAEAARQAVIAERITPELVQSEGFFENFSEKSKWGERYRLPDFNAFPYLAYNVCLQLPDERFSERVFVEDLAEVNYPPLNALLVEKMNIELPENWANSEAALDFLRTTSGSPELQAAYLKNLVPGSVKYVSYDYEEMLASTKGSPAAQTLLVRAIGDFGFYELKQIMKGAFSDQAPKDQPLCFEARVFAAHRLTENLENDFKNSIQRGYGEPDTDMVSYFKGYPEMQAILVEAVFPYMPNIAVYNRGADSGRENWWETGSSLPDLDFVNDENRTRLAEHVVRVLQGTDMDMTDVAQALRQVKADLNEKNFEDYCDLMIVSGKRTPLFLAYAFAPVADKFQHRGYKGIRKYWEELIAFSKECKDIERVLLRISKHEELTEKNLPEYRRLMAEAGELGYELLEYGLNPCKINSLGADTRPLRGTGETFRPWPICPRIEMIF